MIVSGKNVAKELLNVGINIKKIYLSNSFSDEYITRLISKKNIKYNYVENKVLDSLCKEKHQGIVLEVADYEYYNEEDLFNKLEDKSFILILDHIEDPHNFGAIIRTCEAAGVDYIVISKDCS